jgi:hypothetical protein
MPATCPSRGAKADSHGLSRSARQQTRRSANPQVTALQRHRLPKLIVQMGEIGLPAAGTQVEVWVSLPRTRRRSIRDSREPVRSQTDLNGSGCGHG